ncbi:IclR family transcriptional regulator [soil metagenome]
MADVQSLKRAFDILRAVSLHTEGASLAEVARQVALPKSTVSRMLSTLEGIGAVERVTQPEGFRIGPEMITLTAQVAYPRSLSALVRPYLQELAQLSGETISLSIPDGDRALTIDQIDSWRELRLRNWVGKRLPLYCTSDGKLYLAQWHEAAINEYLARPLERYAPNTITDPDQLRQELAQIRIQGYAWNNRERDADLVSIAAPVYDENQVIVAAICLFGPFFRFPPADQRQELIRLVVDTANRVSNRIQILALPLQPDRHRPPTLHDSAIRL